MGNIISDGEVKERGESVGEKYRNELRKRDGREILRMDMWILYVVYCISYNSFGSGFDARLRLRLRWKLRLRLRLRWKLKLKLRILLF